MTLFPDELLAAAEALLERTRRAGVRIATAESCTGGLVAALLTEVAGSSDVVERGYVTYSNAAKEGAIGVPAGLIARHGAVSEPVARAMAEGALARSEAEMTVAITGVAGPGGGSADKPVGLVWFATARKGGTTLAHEERYGDLGRSAVRLAAVRTALGLLSGRLD
ncbi:CinA family protein [Caulobacter sp. S45]|uniref:CinA family protein n=1 Tax=Caulobacter sp. S45 TaxID=1641861 RepID=UPI00157536C8|nr:CinA family protein [Caulobacter sp. S45]